MEMDAVDTLEIMELQQCMVMMKQVKLSWEKHKWIWMGDSLWAVAKKLLAKQEVVNNTSLIQ